MKIKLTLIMSGSALLILLLNIALNLYLLNENERRAVEVQLHQLAEQLSHAANESGNYVSDNIVAHTVESDPRILEITGVRAQQLLEGTANDSSLAVAFGNYEQGTLSDERSAIEEAVRTSNMVFQYSGWGQNQVVKIFYPFYSNTFEAYVIRIMADNSQVAIMVQEQLLSMVVISLVLLEVIIIGSYFLAGMIIKPIQGILGKVNEMAAGQFDTRLTIRSQDELGQLGSRINVMANNLSLYTHRLEQMNEENRKVKDYLESVINQTADAIHVTDANGIVVRVNRAFEQLYGWRQQEILGKQLDFIPEELKEEHMQQQHRLLEGHQIHSYESVRLHKDRSQVEVSISISPIHDENEGITGYISVSRDITGHNRMEELLRRSEKLKTVGQLAAGVAHEIRNPLTTLRGFLQLQQQTDRLNAKHVDLMLSELDRINLIVGEFLILAKPQAVQYQKLDIRYVLGDVVSLLDSQAHLHDIQFELEISLACAMVYCEENQLKQVFINLLKNAIEAMPRGGIIRISLFSLPGSVTIKIKDQGPGIAPEILAKLGEPFITSKASGTGLGLMVSQRIIQNHQGTLEIESHSEEGTVVTVHLPEAQRHSASKLAGPAEGENEIGV
ncbi:ATP-binding protein [Paenibacillus sp. FSL K6-1230]